MDKKQSKRQGFSPSIIDAFYAGFPENWDTGMNLSNHFLSNAPVRCVNNIRSSWPQNRLFHSKTATQTPVWLSKSVRIWDRYLARRVLFSLSLLALHSYLSFTLMELCEPATQSSTHIRTISCYHWHLQIPSQSPVQPLGRATTLELERQKTDVFNLRIVPLSAPQMSLNRYLKVLCVQGGAITVKNNSCRHQVTQQSKETLTRV